jgi:hypothetical protein
MRAGRGEVPEGFSIRTAELLEQLDRAVAEARKVGGDFCLTDIQAAMVMLDRFETSRDPEARARNLANAQHAHDVVASFVERLHLEPDQDAKVREGLAVLSKRLRALRAR